MKRAFFLVIVLVLGLGAAVMMRGGVRHDASLRVRRITPRRTDAPFRDGLYLGRLAAKRGEPHIARGRWATDKARTAFAEGYQEGYAATKTPISRTGRRANLPPLVSPTPSANQWVPESQTMGDLVHGGAVYGSKIRNQ